MAWHATDDGSLRQRQSITPAEAPLFALRLQGRAEEIREAELLKIAKKAQLDQVVRTVVESGEHVDMEAAAEKFRVERERALDCQQVKDAKVALKLAKQRLAATAPARRAKELAEEVIQIDEAQMERKRGLVNELLDRRVVIEVAPATALPPAEPKP